MTLFAISQAIRNAGGQVLICGNQPFGYVFMAEIGRSRCRIVSLPNGKSTRNIPPEPTYRTHVAIDEPSLQIWLASVCNA